MKIANDWNGDASLSEPVYDVRNRGCGLTGVHSNTHKLGAGAGELFGLERSAFDIDRIGVGHRLNDNRAVAADCYAVYLD
jgi:hypothetical protein